MILIVLAVLAVLAWRKVQPLAPSGAQPTGGSNGLDNVSEAMARMEGFYQTGSVAQRSNNPGDVGTYNGTIQSYPDVGDGWDALTGWISGHASAHPSWTFYDMMHYYLTGSTTGTPGPNQDPAGYANYVASYLGVDPNTPVSQVLGG